MKTIVERFKEVTDKFLERRKAEFKLSFINLSLKVSAQELLTTFEYSPIKSLLLPEGSSLGDELQGDLSLAGTAKRENLQGANVRIWGWDYNFEKNGEISWAREIDFALIYDKQDYQKITCYYYKRTEVSEEVKKAWVTNNIKEPTKEYASICRDAVSMAYLETGYEGHNQKCIETPTEEQIDLFVRLAENIIE